MFRSYCLKAGVGSYLKAGLADPDYCKFQLLFNYR